MSRPGITRPVIPKRGEPSGSGLQIHVLDSARAAMFDTLGATRTIPRYQDRQLRRVVPAPRTHARNARQGHPLSAMGHSAPRPIIDAHGADQVHKRVELLPEEIIYLVERGSLLCWKGSVLDLSGTQTEMAGPPMSVQQVYAEMLGVGGLTLERLQVRSLLFSVIFDRDSAPARALGVHISQAVGVLGHMHKPPIVPLPNAAPVACTNTPKCKCTFPLAAPLVSLPALDIKILLAAVRLVLAHEDELRKIMQTIREWAVRWEYGSRHGVDRKLKYTTTFIHDDEETALRTRIAGLHLRPDAIPPLVPIPVHGCLIDLPRQE
ncbi:hypothetical protein DXG01_015465 [Tephrocybe rancida]|nr:hypothetical protein DXG01_015465 [Tephrocybe rancida]